MKTAHADFHNIEAVRALIADDSPFMLKALSKILALEGIFTLVATATDGSQAVRHALTIEPELILMDVHMPHLNGVEATRYIKQFKIKSPLNRYECGQGVGNRAGGREANGEIIFFSHRC